MKILSKRYEKWGIDVDVQFIDEQEIEYITTMRFDNDDQIDKDLQSRIDRKITNLTIDYNTKINTIDIEKLKEKIDMLFESKNTITKKEYEELKEDSKQKLTARVGSG